jgi:rhamnosyl/mannosyltransferase
VLQISKFYPPVKGGIESTVRELTEGLNAVGVPTDVLCAHTRWRGADETWPAGYRVTRAGSCGTMLSTSIAPAMLGAARRLMPRHDVLHVHMPDPMAALALLAVRPRAPVVLHWHSDVVRQRIALHAYEPLQRWVLARADAIVATSEVYAEASQALRAWREKVEIIPIGIGDNAGRSGATRVHEVRRRYHGRNIVFALGRVTYYKGFDVLVQAAAGLPADTVVLIGGDGPLLPELRRSIHAGGLAGRVQLLGALDDDDLHAHFDACDVFCLPSTERSEAFGVAQLEAMAAGKPVVSAEIPGSAVTWINRHGVTGLTVPVRDAPALGEALRRLLTDGVERTRLGKAARQRYLDEFTAERMVQRTVGLYRRLHAA